MDINISRSPATPVVENETAGLIRVYPNPASEDIWIELKAFTGKVHQIELLNASGQQLLRKVAEPDVTLVKLPVEDLPGGVYYVNLYTDSGLFTRKIVIKN
jgi:hypothetical protein